MSRGTRANWPGAARRGQYRVAYLVCLPLVLLLLASTSSARTLPWLRWFEVVEVSAAVDAVPLARPQPRAARALPLTNISPPSAPAESRAIAPVREHVEVTARADSVPVAAPESTLLAAAPLPLPGPVQLR